MLTKFDGDGQLCVAVGNFWEEPVTLHCQTENTDGGWNPGLYEEYSYSTGLLKWTNRVVTFGLKFADLDLDGMAEMIVANGHIYDHEVLDGAQQAQPLQVFSPASLTDHGSRLFRNMTPPGGFAGVTGIGRGLATADIDGDGDIDILYIDKDGPVRLLRNDSPRQGVPLRLRLMAGAGGAP